MILRTMLDSEGIASFAGRRVASLRGRASSPDMPVLSPEIQLLYKSKGRREKDEVDFARVLPLLTEEEKEWLGQALQTVTPGHPWSNRLNPRA